MGNVRQAGVGPGYNHVAVFHSPGLIKGVEGGGGARQAVLAYPSENVNQNSRESSKQHKKSESNPLLGSNHRGGVVVDGGLGVVDGGPINIQTLQQPLVFRTGGGPLAPQQQQFVTATVVGETGLQPHHIQQIQQMQQQQQQQYTQHNEF